MLIEKFPMGSQELLEHRRNKLISGDRRAFDDEKDIARYQELAQSSEVIRYLTGRYVFMTGGTGFIGRAMIEKLIRVCPSIGGIYVLVRGKRGKPASERLEELLANQIFGIIRNRRDLGEHLLREKVHAIGGDITALNFGISDDDMCLLAGRVSIVYNLAATVRFVEPLGQALNLNVDSVSQMMRVCDNLNELDSIVHVSTAYASCSRLDIWTGEQVYEPSVDTDALRSMLDCLESVADLATASSAPAHVSKRSIAPERKVDEHYLARSFAVEALKWSNMLNTYTFTKSMAEHQLLEEARRRPNRYLSDNRVQIAIVRPSVVGGAYEEPTVGFVDTLDGPTAVPYAYYLGYMTMMPSRKWMNCDLVPCDFVVNQLIGASIFLASHNKQSNN